MRPNVELIPYILGQMFTASFKHIGQYMLRLECSKKTIQTPGGNDVQWTRVIFTLSRDIISTNVLRNFHDDSAKILFLECSKGKLPDTLVSWCLDNTTNVTSRMLKRKTAPTPGGHVFKRTIAIFELPRDIIGINVYSKVMMIGHTFDLVFDSNISNFKLDRDIIWENVLTTFHED
ncbi:hypothetical protein DPMN_009605 [Dreissena polymorpha]|uniref:Uncharacterized protein n=1 Tax=Dreissena polymorpha TaxID=45954 RepID=A0A9D4N0L4_DREPO|nr:hypothetical protein DPMN_009605 [Dreissena polymorpha]